LRLRGVGHLIAIQATLAITSAHALGLTVLLLLWLVPALLVAKLAERKGRSFAVYLVASLIIGWIIPLIAALIVRPRVEA
jgi:ABC-type microcin C transport system permease subunit YejB